MEWIERLGYSKLDLSTKSLLDVVKPGTVEIVIESGVSITMCVKDAMLTIVRGQLGTLNLQSEFMVQSEVEAWLEHTSQTLNINASEAIEKWKVNVAKDLYEPGWGIVDRTFGNIQVTISVYRTRDGSLPFRISSEIGYVTDR